jgi:hypothetical protein
LLEQSRQKSVDVNKRNVVRKEPEEDEKLTAILTTSLLSLTTCLQLLLPSPFPMSFLGAVGQAPEPLLLKTFCPVMALSNGGSPGSA